jgi:stage IV sporulation protein FB
MFESDDHIFPAKPEIVSDKNRSSWIKTGISMLLFVAVFFLLFSDNYVLIAEIVAILLIHELGHFVMMKRYGYSSVNILFIPIFGAMVSGEKTSATQEQKFWISILGPLPGIVAGTTGLFYCLNVGDTSFLFEFSLLLLSINLLNLFPLDPLDGGHVIEALFFPSNDQFKMYFTLVSSLLLILIGLYFEFFILVIFGFFMSMKVRSLQKSQRIHQNLDQINFNYRKSYKDLSNKEYWTIRRIFLENNPKIKEIIPDELALWENEKLIVDQVRQILTMDIQKNLSNTKKWLLFAVFVLALVLPSYLLFQNMDLIVNTFFDVTP